MKLNKNSWHYKVFTWFKGYPPTFTSLCPYVRTVFLWAPLTWLFGRGFIGRLRVAYVMWTVSIVSVLAIGLHKHPEETCVVLALMGFAVFVVLGVVFFFWVAENASMPTIPEKYARTRIVTGGIAVAGKLLWAYVEAAHNKVCPFIEFED